MYIHVYVHIYIHMYIYIYIYVNVGHSSTVRVDLPQCPIGHYFFPYKVSSPSMEGLHELRRMVVFPAEETMRGHSCYSGD